MSENERLDPKLENCERLTVLSVESSPFVRLMTSALRNAGCNFNISRHISCEACGKGMAGGYDRKTNQIVLCTDYCQDIERVTATLSHELVHMYDHCTTTINFGDINHLACTEVRAANLVDCKNPLPSILNGETRTAWRAQ